MRKHWWIGPALAAAAVVLAACGTNSPTDPAPSTSSPAAAAQANARANAGTVKTVKMGNGTVLVDAQGRTLYWFRKDTPTTSNCNGSCATAWPPIMGKLTAAAGTSLPHSFGTIKRANGQTQATYDGHPLYTFAGDSKAGQANGNNINASGGRWWAMTISGAKLRHIAAAADPSSSSSSTSGSGGGGW